MNTQEAAALLAVAAAFDNRKPDADAAMAWGIALEGYEFADCRNAIVAHYRETREWLMPSDVIDNIQALRAKRMEPFGRLTPPQHIQGDPADEMKWILWAREEIQSGRATTPADIGMDDPSGYPKRDLAELGIANEERGGFPRRLGPVKTTNVAEPVAHLRGLLTTTEHATTDHRDAENETEEHDHA